MNIIRTTAVELTVIPAIAYKQKLASGGAGIRILRLDRDAATMGLLDKRSGEIQTFHKIDFELFPPEAFDEAMELVAGLPYSARGKIAVKVFTEVVEEEDFVDIEEDENFVESDDPEKIDMTDTPEYRAILERYTDEKGKLNYTLMNKDFIQFAAKSRVVSTMISERAHTDAIVLFVVKSRAALIAGKKDSLDDLHAEALIATLDEIDPRSAFKELKAHINRMLARTRR